MAVLSCYKGDFLETGLRSAQRRYTWKAWVLPKLHSYSISERNRQAHYQYLMLRNVQMNIVLQMYSLLSIHTIAVLRPAHTIICGDTIDIWKQEGAKANRFFNNSKYISREHCIAENFLQAIHKTIPNCTCNHACEETKYTMSFENMAVNSTGWYFEFRNRDPVTRVKIVAD